MRPARRRNGPYQPLRLPTRPAAAAQIQIILFRVKTRECFVSSESAFAHSLKPPSFVWIAHPRRPSPAGRRVPSPCARTSLISGLRILRLSLPLAYRISPGMLSSRYLYRPGGPPPTPTHALGSRPSHDRFAVSASRNPSTPDFSDVLHEHPPLHLLDSALSGCSPARSLPAKPS